jgi:hypothetical protein
MTIYRAHRRISIIGTERLISPGEVFHESLMKPKSIAVLEERGYISAISGPPLGLFPGWEVRGKKLERKGIVTAEQFLEAPTEELAELAKVKGSTVDRWKEEVISWLTVPAPKG